MKIVTTLGKSKIEFDTETGHFYWLDCCRKPFRNGHRAEYKTTNGYFYISANQQQHSASRLAYKLAYKVDPGNLEIDHINRIRTDNRPENLRLVTRVQQLRNRRFSKNKCGATGVSLHTKTGLFRARYRFNTTYHKTIKEAEESYQHMFDIAA